MISIFHIKTVLSTAYCASRIYLHALYDVMQFALSNMLASTDCLVVNVVLPVPTQYDGMAICVFLRAYEHYCLAMYSEV